MPPISSCALRAKPRASRLENRSLLHSQRPRCSREPRRFLATNLTCEHDPDRPPQLLREISFGLGNGEERKPRSLLCEKIDRGSFRHMHSRAARQDADNRDRISRLQDLNSGAQAARESMDVHGKPRCRRKIPEKCLPLYRPVLAQTSTAAARSASAVPTDLYSVISAGRLRPATLPRHRSARSPFTS